MRLWQLLAAVGLLGLIVGATCLWARSRPQTLPQPLTASVSTVPLRSGLAPDDRLTVGIDDTDMAKCVAMYAELTGRELWPGKKSALQRFDEEHGYKLSRWGWIKPFFAPTAGIIYHRDGRYRAEEVKEHLEGVFRSAGLIPVPQGRRYFVLGPS